MTTWVTADGSILAWARDRSALTVEAAAPLLKTTPENLRRIEAGESYPTATLFRRMARIYLLPEATLLGVTRLPDRPLPRDFRSFAGVPVGLSYETIAAIRAVEARQEAIAALAELDLAVVPPNLPIYSLRDDPERLGTNFRKQLGFPVIDQLRLAPEQAFTKWRVLVEGLGVSVYVEPLGADDSRGVSVYFNAFPAIIVDQNEKFAGARSFTLVHELAHILVRQAGISNFNPKNVVEAFCNKFAAAFLLPIEAVQAAFPAGVLSNKTEPTIADLDAAAKKLCVTISQVARRLESLSFTKAGYYQRIVSMLAAPKPKAKGKRGPEYKYLYLSQFGHYLPDTVFGSLDRGTISTIEASRLLDTSPVHFPKIRGVLKQRRDEAMGGRVE